MKDTAASMKPHLLRQCKLMCLTAFYWETRVFNLVEGTET